MAIILNQDEQKIETFDVYDDALMIDDCIYSKASPEKKTFRVSVFWTGRHQKYEIMIIKYETFILAR